MRGHWFLLFSLSFTSGCGGGTGTHQPSPAPGPKPLPEAVPEGAVGEFTVREAPVSYSAVEASIGDDPEVEALVAPFRNRMGEEIQEVIGETTGLLSKAQPEGTLGNFAADAMLWAANEEFAPPVHMALTNNGGLRVPIGPGAITIGQMFELMPFENLLSVLTLSGSQVQRLCDEVAAGRGEPIAGFSFRIEEEEGRWTAVDIRIGGEPLEETAEYRLVTNDYLASGGGDLTPLHSPLDRIDLPVLLRDAFIQYVQHSGVIEPEIQGRIKGGIGR